MSNQCRRYAFIPLFACLAPSASAGAQGLPRAKPEDVGLSSVALATIVPALKTLVDSGKIAGAVAAVARHGKLVYLESVGMMDSARTAPMRTDAVFRVFSMTKPVTSTAVMQLYERGKLKLDDPVAKYIPSFARVQVYAGGPAVHPMLHSPDRAITIADLLTHTGGLTYGAFGNTPVDSIYRAATLLTPTRTIAQFADSIAALPLLSSPGTKWTYSMSLDVLGRVVEVASGKSFDRYLHDEIFAPLGMRETAFHITPTMNGRVMWLFGAAGGQLRGDRQLLDPSYRDEGKVFAGGQGLLSTINDYLRFTQMLLNGGELDGHRVLKRETVALMMQNHLPAALTPIPLLRGYGFGYGGAVQVDSGPNFPAAPGTFRWSGYASTFFWIDPKADLIAMVWTQFVPIMNNLEVPFQRTVYSALNPLTKTSASPASSAVQSAPSVQSSQLEPVNDLPNPYRTIEGWAKLGADRMWGSTSAVDIDRDGKSIWVAERCSTNSCVGSKLDPVLKFDENGKLVTSFGAGLIAVPHGIYVDKDDNVWVTDCTGCTRPPLDSGGPPRGHQIFKFSPTGKLLMTLGKAGGGKGTEYFYQPNDVLVAPNGDIFVVDGHSSADGANARIFKFSKDGSLIKMWGNKGTGRDDLDQPHCLAMDSRGRLFVGDRGNNRIKIFDQSGKLLDTWYQFSRPSGLYIDKNDMLYVTDSESGSVNKAHIAWKRGIRIGSAKDGKVIAFIPDPNENATNTSAAEGIAVDAAGHIFGAEVGPKALKRYEHK